MPLRSCQWWPYGRREPDPFGLNHLIAGTASRVSWARNWRSSFFAGEGGGLHLTFNLRRAALLVRLDPVIVGGAVATVAPQQRIDEGLTDKLAVAIG
jgi:hypothetical protein